MSPEARREQLIDLGLEMVSQRPLDEVSIDAIAEVAGVSRALLFHYFDSKQDFHVAIARAQGERMLALTAPDESLGDPVAILAGSLSAFVDYVSEHRLAYTAFLRGSSSADPAMRAVIDATRQEMVDRILRYAPHLGVEVTPTARMGTFGWIAFVEEVTIGWLHDRRIGRDELLALITGSLPALAPVFGGISAR
ncbi:MULTISPECIES: TetR/AcrR family transcriptional regulator [unclassified Gordonia (in: high G+C Gram-positive bacteria)]